MKRRILIAVAVIAPAILSPVLGRVMPGVYTNGNALILCYGVIYAIAALALNLLMGYAGQISLGHAAFVGVGAYTAGIVAGTHAKPMILGMLASAGVGAVVALIVGLPALRLRGLRLGISTLAFAAAMQKFVFNSSLIGGGSGGKGVPFPKIGSFEVRLNADFFVIAFVVFLAVWWLDRNVTSSRLGRALFALRSDEQVASSFGINVNRHKLIAFAICGGIAGVAGDLFGHALTIVQAEQFTFEFSLFFVIMVVVGGLGSRTGVTIAALLFTILPRALGTVRAFQYLTEIIGAVLLIVTVARHPGGLAQAFTEAREAKRRKAQPEPEDDTILTLPLLPSVGESERGSSTGDLLVVRDVSVRFGGLQVLENASLTVPAGRIVGLIGPNGAGKSTMFNVISGFVRPDAGEITFAGVRIDSLAPHERTVLGMSRSFQLIGLAKDRSVMENFLIAQHANAGYGAIHALLGTPRVRASEREMRRRASEAIELLGFGRYADRAVATLSHGQQRLVELGCALITSPDLVLLDEPSAGMSPAAAEALAQRLRLIRDELHRTVLLIEHHIPIVMDTCDEVYVLNAGTVLAHGTTDEIVANPAVVSAYLGEAVA